MSVIMRNICGGGSGSSSSKGFPPGDVTNISVRSEYKCAKLKWTDPDPSIYNGATLSTWNSTIIVRKEGSAPTSIKDGTVVIVNTTKNKYKDTEFVDNNVVANKTYYYRFYTLSTDKVYNDSTSMIYKVKILEVKSILKNNSWKQINTASESGIASSIWNIGDEIDLTLSGTFNETVTLQIWDFNHFDKSDGSGKAGICFGMKNLMKDHQKMNNTVVTYPDWNTSDMRNNIMQSIFNSMPSNLQNVIKEVNTYSVGSDQSSYGYGPGLLCKDKVFLPGPWEIGISYNDNGFSQGSYEQYQEKFPIFTDSSSRQKSLSNGNGYLDAWWTRSHNFLYQSSIICVYSGGSIYDFSQDDELGVCFCFNV